MGFDTDLSDSTFDFMRVVYPKLIECKFISGKVVPVESVTATGTTRDLDMLAGIDAWQIKEMCGMRGISSRVQWGKISWDTFTVRKSRTSGAETEYVKRKRSIETKEWLYPILTVQAYITERRTGDLLSVAIARTEDVFEMIENDTCQTRINYSDGNSFFVVRWKDMDKIHVWTNG